MRAWSHGLGGARGSGLEGAQGRAAQAYGKCSPGARLRGEGGAGKGARGSGSVLRVSPEPSTQGSTRHPVPRDGMLPKAAVETVKTPRRPPNALSSPCELFMLPGEVIYTESTSLGPDGQFGSHQALCGNQATRPVRF